MSKALDAIELAEPSSKAHVRPDYTAEVQHWWAVLQPFLSGEDGVLSKNCPLGSFSSGVHMAQGQLKSFDWFFSLYNCLLFFSYIALFLLVL